MCILFFVLRRHADVICMLLALSSYLLAHGRWQSECVMSQWSSLSVWLSVVNITIGIFSDYSRWSSNLAWDDMWQDLSKGTNVSDLSKVPVSANSQSSWYRESGINVKHKHISTKNVFSSNIYHSFKAKHDTEIPNGIPIWMTPQRGQGSYTQKNKEINTGRCKIAIFWQ